MPESRLPHPSQRIQRSTLLLRRPHIDGTALAGFLSTLRWPARYLDFEAVTSAVPGYVGVRPWEHVPYLFSVHTQADPGADPANRWFLMEPGKDQREDLLRELLDALGDSGSVVVYSAAFESAVLRRLAEWYPQFARRLAAVIDRVIDLLRPFDEFSYYHHAQRGKVSLKTILPILTRMDYSELNIQDGYTANVAYRFLCDHPREVEQVEQITAHLVDYCRTDTLAMVRILQELRTLSGAGA